MNRATRLTRCLLPAILAVSLATAPAAAQELDAAFAERFGALALDCAYREYPNNRQAGLAAVTGEHYEGSHWLGSFAVYLVTSRGGGGNQPSSRRIEDDPTPDG